MPGICYAMPGTEAAHWYQRCYLCDQNPYDGGDCLLMLESDVSTLMLAQYCTAPGTDPVYGATQCSVRIGHGAMRYPVLTARMCYASHCTRPSCRPPTTSKTSSCRYQPPRPVQMPGTDATQGASTVTSGTTDTDNVRNSACRTSYGPL
eukprot:467773-Rhodomonas_salina.2